MYFNVADFPSKEHKSVVNLLWGYGEFGETLTEKNLGVLDFKKTCLFTEPKNK